MQTGDVTHSPVFWRKVWERLLRTRVQVPDIPKLPALLKETLAKYQLLLVYIPPGLTEECYPRHFVRPDWNKLHQHGPVTHDRFPLRGGWALVEAIPKPDWLPSIGYPSDALIAEWGIANRYELAWSVAMPLASSAVDKKFLLPAGSASLMSVEEWNLTANLFNWLRRYRRLPLPNLGATIASEWCRNSGLWRESAEGLTAGFKTSGGLANVGHAYHATVSRQIGFRYIIWLESQDSDQ